jgi:hypothetical protein
MKTPLFDKTRYLTKIICALTVALLAFNGKPHLFCQQSSQQNDEIPGIPRELPLPPAFSTAQANAEKVSQSDLPSDMKETVQGKFKEVQSEFEKAWGPAKTNYADYRKTMLGFKKEGDTLKEMSRRHEAKHPNPKDTKAVAAYNKEAADGNIRIEAYKKKIKETADEFDAKNKEAYAKVRQLMATTVKEFNDAANFALASKHRFHKGLAWNQLLAAAHGDTNNVFDGTKLGNGTTDAVDTSNIDKLSPEERKKLQNQPGAQLPMGFHATPNSPPPPPK